MKKDEKIPEKKFFSGFSTFTDPTVFSLRASPLSCGVVPSGVSGKNIGNSQLKVRVRQKS